ncbi:MAG: helix-turn-helix transcriptional regulator [Elusimicrobia bacterium]|nr:helix-turn-helix transcriptional regulator [Elusimicrobiota bacterium]
MKSEESFSRLVSSAMARRGLGLREFCRRAELDPSFFSKVLAGKRSPPSEEEPLRRVARALELDPVEVIVAAGRIPTDWGALWSDADLVRAVHAVATGRRPAARRVEPAPPAPHVSRPARPDRAAPRPSILPGRGLSEELL